MKESTFLWIVLGSLIFLSLLFGYYYFLERNKVQKVRKALPVEEKKGKHSKLWLEELEKDPSSFYCM